MQFLLNALIAAAVYALVALSFSLIYSTTRFFHFAHGAVYAVGAYSAYVVIEAFRRSAQATATSSLGSGGAVPWWAPVAAVLAAIIVATVLGALMELGIYRPLRRMRATPVVLLAGWPFLDFTSMKSTRSWSAM